MVAKRIEGQIPSLKILVQDIPEDGLIMDGEVTPEQLELAPEEAQLQGRLHWACELSKTQDGVAIQGTLSGVFRRECVRCLALFQETVVLPCQGVFQADNSMKRQTMARTQGKSVPVRGTAVETEEVYPCVGNRIELGPMLREHIILATPIKSLCHPGCLGLCPFCKTNLNQFPCECAEKPGVSDLPLSVLSQRVKGINISLF